MSISGPVYVANQQWNSDDLAALQQSFSGQPLSPHLLPHLTSDTSSERSFESEFQLSTRSSSPVTSRLDLLDHSASDSRIRSQDHHVLLDKTNLELREDVAHEVSFMSQTESGVTLSPPSPALLNLEEVGSWANTFKGSSTTVAPRSPAEIKQPHTLPSKCRKGLPLIFQTETGTHEIITKYDTGTHDNHMSLEQAEAMGYKIDTGPSSKGRFQLPTGREIEAVGRVTAEVEFAHGPGHGAGPVTCFFNVFSRLSSAVLIGMTFLNATETITKYTKRLVDLPTGPKRCLRLRAVGNATNQVSCIVNGCNVIANADTGSEIALMSGEYATKHGLLKDYSCEELELADGSLEYTSGHATVTFQIPGAQLKSETLRPQKSGSYGSRTKTIRFHVLKHLQFDMILDEDIVSEFNVFQNGLSTIKSAAANSIASLSPIIHLRSMEKTASRVTEKVKDLASSIFSSKPKPTTEPQSTGDEMSPIIDAQPEITRLLEAINSLDQAENRRQDQLNRQVSYTQANMRYDAHLHTLYVAERRRLNEDLDRLLNPA